MNDEQVRETVEKPQESDEQEKLIPVSEAIRYRKRAQSAEKRCEVLANELSQARNEHQQLSAEKDNLEQDHKLLTQLSAGNVRDLETASMLVKSRMQQRKIDSQEAIEQLRVEKPWLFSHGPAAAGFGEPTASVRSGTNETAVNRLEKAARKAARSGNRRDLQNYLKLRRTIA